MGEEKPRYRIGINSPVLTGHLNPILPLARELVSRGHKVTFFGSTSVKDVVERNGLAFVPMGDGLEDLNRMNFTNLLARLRNDARQYEHEAGRVMDELPQLLKDHGTDVLICDEIQFGCPFAAEISGVPAVIFSFTIPFRPDPMRPPMVFGEMVRKRRVTRALKGSRDTLLEWTVYPAVGMSRVRRAIEKRRLAAGLTPFGKESGKPMVRAYSRVKAVMCQLPEDFDFPWASRPPHLHYLGPPRAIERNLVHEHGGERGKSETFVYACLGTLAKAPSHLFSALALGLGRLDAKSLLSLGGASGSEEQVPQCTPENVQIAKQADQLEMLEYASLFITHAGTNSVLEALAAGVPMLCLPINRDHPAIAARVEWCGCGLRLKPGQATPKAIANKANQILTDRRFFDAARRMKGSIEACGGASKGADLVEQAARSEGKILNK